MLSNEILLLKIIKYGGKLSLLRSRGLTYSQIAMLIKKQEDERNVLITDDNITKTSHTLNGLRTLKIQYFS